MQGVAGECRVSSGMLGVIGEMQVVISQLNAMYTIQTDYPLLLAASVVALLPCLIIFMVFQKQIIASVAMTGLK
jgi:multiple sugar transport system permease protein